MNIALLGTGLVGRTLAGRLAGLGHHVVIGTRDVAATLDRTEPDGTPDPFRGWHAEHPEVGLATFADAAARSEIVLHAATGGLTLDALHQAGAARLAGKVLVDIANPLDFAGFPPTLLVKDTDSLGEQIQRAFPDARVVKALNTMNCGLMADPRQLADGDHTVFLSGNDAAAKATVVDLLRGLGWTDILDLGDISTARGPEMFLPLWLRVRLALGTHEFNIKIVR